MEMLERDSILQPLQTAGEEDVADFPQYYREGFFSKDSLFHPELPGGRYGTAGDPVPYTVRGDSVITSLLLLCFILVLISFSNVRNFFARQVKDIFYLSRDAASEVNETATEVRFQLFLVVLAALFISLLYYFYTIHYIGDDFVLPSQYHLIVICWGIILIYFALKVVLYYLVNNVFFDSKRNEHWVKSLLFITAVEAVLLFPAVIVQAYFHLPIQNVEIYFCLVLIFVKLLAFYKTYVIFFRRNVVSLQIILYFCALEIVPLLNLWSILDLTTNSLKVNL